MNKLGISLATDSSVTIRHGENTRTYGSAEKIFPLSEDHQVALLHSGSTEFMGHPYEVLITEWKKTLSRPLAEVKSYAESFVRWLSQRSDLFSQELQEEFVEDHATEYFLDLRKVLLEKLEQKHLTEDTWHSEETLDFTIDFFKNDLDWLRSLKSCESLTEKWADTVTSSIQHKLKEATDFVFDDIPWNLSIAEVVENIGKEILHRTIGNDQDARIAFAGYGFEQIYPEHVWVDLRGMIGDKPRYTIDSLLVTNDNDSWLQTHAQSEAIHTYLRAYHVSFLDKAKSNLREAVLEILDMLDRKLDDETYLEIENEVSTLRDSAIEKLVSGFEDNSHNRFVKPFTGTLAGLPTTSLAKMAESLIELQILRQSSQGIQDTVGGPVDVAVITLENGFTWFRHKTIDQLWKNV
jgi:hypothetical protein